MSKKNKVIRINCPEEKEGELFEVMCEHYFGKERAEKYRKNPDDIMTSMLLDIYDYGYDRAMENYYGTNYDPSYSVDLGGKTLVQ